MADRFAPKACSLTKILLFVFVFFVGSCGLLTGIVNGAEFRVDTLVYQKGVGKPLSQNTTYFTNETICDISRQAAAKDPADSAGSIESVLVIDRVVSAATICRTKPQHACTVSLDEVLRTVAAITTRVESDRVDDKARLIQFAAAPKFDVSWNSTGSQLRMLAEPLSYVVQASAVESLDDAAAADNQVAADYREFADWAARISATGRYGLPPTARLEVNDTLARKGQLPNRVEVTRIASNGAKATYFSEHTFHWQLNAKDHAIVAEWKERGQQWTAVDLKTLQFGQVSEDTAE